MRLLNTKTGEFKEFKKPRQVRYAILSHVWSQSETNLQLSDTQHAEPEQTYDETCRIILKSTESRAELLPQYTQKIQRFCKVARRDGFDWGWVDSACIDKGSSSELSEAINSMYDWYRCAGVCYAFLHDLPDSNPSDPTFCDNFRKAKWFTRGWTLQELLAPRVLLFLSRTWQVIGSKYSLASEVQTVTGIDSSILTFSTSLDTISVARKMSWAASRETTRPEDEAYSLMGIFGVTISISYGEGRDAFIRLQEKILKRSPDQTIFTWGPFLRSPDFKFAPPSRVYRPSSTTNRPPSTDRFLLTLTPRLFQDSSEFQHLSIDDFAELLGRSPDHTLQEFTVTSYGVRAHVPLLRIYCDEHHLPHDQPTHLALLACQDQAGNVLALLLRPQSQTTDRNFVVGGVVANTNEVLAPRRGATPPVRSHYYRVTYLSLAQVTSCRRDIEMVDLYIPHRPPTAEQMLELEESIHASLYDSQEDFEVFFSGWSRMLLARDGYTITPAEDVNVATDRGAGHLVPTPSESSVSTATALVISKGNEEITIRIGRCTCNLAHLLAVSVSARGRSTSLDEKWVQRQHYKLDHPVHVRSWVFGGGFASKEVPLKSNTQPTITLRLTFSHETRVPAYSKAYRLGVEILLPPSTVLSTVVTVSAASSSMPTDQSPPLYSQVVASARTSARRARWTHPAKPEPLLTPGQQRTRSHPESTPIGSTTTHGKRHSETAISNRGQKPLAVLRD